MGSHAYSKSQSTSNAFGIPGTMLSPDASLKAHVMTNENYYKPMVDESIEGMKTLKSFGERLMAGESFGRDAGYDAEMAGLARMGLATSAPGIIAQGNNIYQRRLKGAELLDQASRGLAYLRMLPEEMRAKVLAMLLNQKFEMSASRSDSWSRAGSYNSGGAKGDKEGGEGGGGGGGGG